MRRVLSPLAAVAVLAVGGCAAFSPAPGATPAEDVYNRNCIVCHGKNGGGADGPSLLERDLTHERIEDQIRNGAQGMPAFRAKLSDEQIRLAAEWVEELRRRAGKQVPPG